MELNTIITIDIINAILHKVPNTRFLLSTEKVKFKVLIYF
jgi:hypothetical protein